MKYQFDICSYKKLTDCIHARVQWVRECRGFLKDDNSKRYGYIRATVRLKIVINCQEIRRLLKMRRVLKKSDLRNWDTNRLGDVV